MSYGVFKTKEEHDQWMAEWNGAISRLNKTEERIDDKLDILKASEAGQLIGDVVQAFGGGAAADIAQRIADYLSQAERAAALVDLIPKVELGGHSDTINRLKDTNSILAAFARGFVRGLK